MSKVESAVRGFQGLRVLSLESRRAKQMAQLIVIQGGVAISAPSMREVPLRENPAALAFAEELFRGNFDLVIFLTGVGTRILFGAVETKFPRERLVESLARLTVVARGPKPAAVLREFAVPITLLVPESNTWRHILKVIAEYPPLPSLQGKRIAIQEYGVSNRELIEDLEAQGASVTPVPVYQWELPEDTGPLRRAIDEIVSGKIDVLLVTSAIQVHHMMRMAADSGLADAVRHGLNRAVVASIGPVSTEGLREHGISADLESAPPRMGQLVYEAAQKAKPLLLRKRGTG